MKWYTEGCEVYLPFFDGQYFSQRIEYQIYKNYCLNTLWGLECSKLSGAVMVVLGGGVSFFKSPTHLYDTAVPISVLVHERDYALSLD